MWIISIEALVNAIGDICDLYQPPECWNYLKATGYASDQKREALNLSRPSEGRFCCR
jgi:hypothetical protein